MISPTSEVSSRAAARAFIHESTFWSAAKLQELQWYKLGKLLNHAYNTCEFYRQRFDKAGLHPRHDFHSFDCLQKLPALTKQDIQQYREQLRTSDPLVTGIKLNSTGGSTGMPLNFYQDDNYQLWAGAAGYRAWRCFPGVSKWSIEAVLWGADRDVGRAFSYLALFKSLVRYRTVVLNTFDLNAERIRKFFRLYNFLRPEILRGYATSLYYVANHFAERGMQVHRPKIIVSSAEMMRPKMRERVSTVFGADVIDSYGCREVSQIATECGCHCGLHLVMENQFVEVIDGQILVTNLNNLGMPFIRYQVGDLAERIDTEPCECGRQAHRLIGLCGRDNENIELPGGKIVNGEFFEFLFFGFDEVEQFQVVYSRHEQQLLLRLKVMGPHTGIETMVRERLREGFNFSNVRFDFTDKFDKTPTGKLRFVYSVDRFEEVASHV